MNDHWWIIITVVFNAGFVVAGFFASIKYLEKMIDKLVRIQECQEKRIQKLEIDNAVIKHSFIKKSDNFTEDEVAFLKNRVS